jgi:hypothetical protein
MSAQIKREDEDTLALCATRNDSSLHDEVDHVEFSSRPAKQRTSTMQQSTHTKKAPTDAAIGQDLLKKKQTKFLKLWPENFNGPGFDSRPPEEYIKALAISIGAQPYSVAQYFEQGLWRLDDGTWNSDDTTDGDRTPSRQFRHTNLHREPYSLAQANSHLSATTLAFVENYVSACRRRRSQNDGRRSVNTGPFNCTFGCGYRTKRAFDWRRHEETHEPQELWLCIICIQRDANNPFLVNRKDKFLKHTTDKHADYSLEKVLEESKVDFVPRAEWSCVYCGFENDSWENRCRHVLAHFEDEAEAEAERGKKRSREIMESDKDEPSRESSASISNVGSDGVDHSCPN